MSWEMTELPEYQPKRYNTMKWAHGINEFPLLRYQRFMRRPLFFHFSNQRHIHDGTAQGLTEPAVGHLEATLQLTVDLERLHFLF